ncbi:MAG: type II secretion system F family protein [Acidimicrobiia bacterium]|nr:type II secretion system F family protein [Acidimicrobiia bacterium]
MDPTLLQFAAVGSVVGLVGMATYAVASGLTSARATTKDRLATYGRRITAQVEANRDAEMARPFSERVVAPIIERFGGLFTRWTPVSWIERTEQRLMMAGNPGNLDASTFAIIKVGAVVGGIVIWGLAQGGQDPGMKVLMLGLLVFGGIFGPDAWLNRIINDRNVAIRSQLPDVLDLLVISVEAGLGFDAALARVVKVVPGVLSDEFHRMIQETRVGVARRTAMRNLRDRTDVDELRGFLLAMMQAEAFGVSISRTLRVQADEMRIKRRQIAQEKAHAAPVKLIGPLVLLIMVIFIVLLGPAVLSIQESGLFG